MGVKPKIKYVVGWTSDGDLALIEGLKQGSFLFAYAPHVRCDVRTSMQQNVKNKLKQLRVGGKDEKEQRSFIEDIFGYERDDPLVRGTEICVGGLVDLSKENFRAIYPMKKAAWDAKERRLWESLGNWESRPKFFDWFMRFKVPEIEDSYLPEIRAKIINDRAPGRITNKDSGILHLLALQNQRFLKLPLEKAIEKLQQCVDTLVKVRQNALFSLDEETASLAHNFPVFKRIKLDSDTMNPEQRSAHLKKVLPTTALTDSGASAGGIKTRCPSVAWKATLNSLIGKSDSFS